MTAEERTAIRLLIDKKAREKIAAEDPSDKCGRCGTHRDNHTRGCDACMRRHNNRRRAAARDRMLAAIGPCVGITPHQQVATALGAIRMPRREW